MASADHFLHGPAVGTPLSLTTDLLARNWQENARALCLALAACQFAGTAQQAIAILFFLWPQPTRRSSRRPRAPCR